MHESILSFDGIEWQGAAPYARHKVIQRGERRFRLLELTPGFEEVGWCQTQHIGIVVSGHLQIEFADGIEDVAEGDAICIEAGESSKHKAIVNDCPAILFLIEQAAPDASDSKAD